MSSRPHVGRRLAVARTDIPGFLLGATRHTPAYGTLGPVGGRAVEKGGAVTLDLGPNWNPAVGPIGTFDEAQVAQVKAVHQGLLNQ